MIIVFGDHQPQMNIESEKFLLGQENSEDIGNSLNKYTTSFLIWRNYDFDSVYIEKMSANYLSSFILNEANFELPVFNRFLLELYKEYPIITLQGIEDKNGTFYATPEEIPNDNLFKLYESLQYNNLFDID